MFNGGPQHGEAIGSYRGDPLYHASLAPAEYAALIGAIGFEVIDHATNDRRADARCGFAGDGAAARFAGLGFFERGFRAA
jgi:hypothetical protein